MDDPLRLVMLARVPQLGRVKSRLAEHVGQPQALGAHIRLLRRNLCVAAACGMPLELHYVGDADIPFFRSLVKSSNALLVPQASGDIGQKMLAAAQFANGPSIVIGSDCGGLSVSYLHEAAAALKTSEVVLGPAEDGGYVLIAQQRPVPELFSNIDWGTGEVTRQTLERADREGVGVAQLPLQWDVDTIKDWRRFLASHKSPGSK